MATLLLKVSHKERRSVVCFLLAKGLSTNAIHSEMHPVYCDKCCTGPVTHFGVSSLLSQESVIERKRPGRHVVLMTDATIASVDSLVLSVGLIDGINA